MKPTTEIQMANTRIIWTTYRETGLDPESNRRGRPKTKLWKMLLENQIVSSNVEQKVRVSCQTYEDYLINNKIPYLANAHTHFPDLEYCAGYNI